MVLVLAASLGSLFGQGPLDGSFKISLQPGMNATLVPSRNNIFDTGSQNFETKHAITPGAEINLELWPLAFPNFGYGYGMAYSAGWMVGTASRMGERGHHFYGGTEDYRFVLEMTTAHRATYGYFMVDNYTKEWISSSSYGDIKRLVMGGSIALNGSSELSLSYVRETYSENPSLEWLESSSGVQLKYYSGQFQMEIESIFNHPVYGGTLVADNVIPVDISKQAIYLRISIIKRIDIKGNPYRNMIGL